MRHEILLSLLGLSTIIALVIRAGLLHTLTLQTIFVTICYLAAITYTSSRLGDHWQKLRFLAGYFFVLWYYFAVASFVPTLGLAIRDASLLAIDQQLFGVTPAIRMQSATSTLMTELMSGCYLSYLVYIHAAAHGRSLRFNDLPAIPLRDRPTRWGSDVPICVFCFF